MSPKESSIPFEEYKRRYIARIAEVAKMDEEDAACVWECQPYECHIEGWEEDPEGSADEELSYWEADE